MKTGKAITVLTPWKPNKGAFQLLAQDFVEKISHNIQIKWEAPSRTLNGAHEEAEYFIQFLKKNKAEKIFYWILDPSAKVSVSTNMLKGFWDRFIETPGVHSLCILVGGAHGLPAICSELSPALDIQLSHLTMSHEIATLVILEQLYRVNMMSRGHPYHHGEMSNYAKHCKRL